MLTTPAEGVCCRALASFNPITKTGWKRTAVGSSMTKVSVRTRPSTCTLIVDDPCMYFGFLITKLKLRKSPASTSLCSFTFNSPVSAVHIATVSKTFVLKIGKDEVLSV
eukprot:764091-Hanusia_phi.AAC.5